MTNGGRWAALAIAVLLAVGLAACGDDGPEVAGGGATTSTTAPAQPTASLAPATTTTTRAGTVTSAAPAAPACPENAIAPGASDVTTAPGDFDGDGRSDTLRAYRAGSAWHLRVELAAGGAADTTVAPQGPVAVKALGGVNLGKPAHVAFATVGSGAATTIVGLYFLKSCQVRPVVNEEATATFPVGATVRNHTGLECTDHGNDGTPNLIWHQATSDDGVTFRATDTIYAFSGESIATTAPGVVGPRNIAAADPQFPKYSTLTCGGLSRP